MILAFWKGGSPGTEPRRCGHRLQEFGAPRWLSGEQRDLSEHLVHDPHAGGCVGCDQVKVAGSGQHRQPGWVPLGLCLFDIRGNQVERHQGILLAVDVDMGHPQRGERSR